MTLYTQHKNRIFYRVIDKKHVTRVVNKISISEIDAGDNEFIMVDASEGILCSKEEFESQLKTAMDRINQEKI
jgi:hypothetical protein